MLGVGVLCCGGRGLAVGWGVLFKLSRLVQLRRCKVKALVIPRPSCCIVWM